MAKLTTQCKPNNHVRTAGKQIQWMDLEDALDVMHEHAKQHVEDYEDEFALAGTLARSMAKGKKKLPFKWWD